MILSDVADAVADQLDTIAGLRVFAYPPSTLTPPAAIVTYPEAVTFDATYGRGMDRLVLPVVLVVSKVTDRSSRDRLLAFCDGSGASSVKAVLESGSYTAFDVIRVADIEFDDFRVGGADYLGALFSVEIAGSGSA